MVTASGGVCRFGDGHAESISKEIKDVEAGHDTENDGWDGKKQAEQRCIDEHNENDEREFYS